MSILTANIYNIPFISFYFLKVDFEKLNNFRIIVTYLQLILGALLSIVKKVLQLNILARCFKQYS